jgi:hypothetical protein
LQLIRRYRIPALFCALAVLLCELISRPFVPMGVADDWPYILSAQTLAATGHIVYNGWAAPILGWQLYLGAAFIKLFGFSFTSVRMSTLLVSITLAFVLQRTLVRAGISDFNATLGTLALVLSPLYLMLSVTYMTDIFGLFAIVLCLYGCLRALQASTSRATILWLCFAVILNALCGTSRQIAWLGILVMVPSTLWLLRSQRRGLPDQRRILLAGAAANLLGVLFIYACIHWFSRQPYTLPEHVFVDSYSFAHTLAAIFYFFLDLPFLLVPIVALFLPEIRKSHSRVLAMLAAITGGYLLLAFLWRHTHPNLLLEPTLRDWVGVYGIFEGDSLQGIPPVFLGSTVRILLTIASLGGLLGLIASLAASQLSSRRTPPTAVSSPTLTWKQLATLLLPFSLAYTLLLLPRAASSVIYDRYALSLLVVALIGLVRYYQQKVHPRLPLVSILLVGAIATYGVAATHNLFSLYRARVALAAELRAHGIPDTSVDYGWEYNIGVELQHANHLNEPTIAVPANAYVPQPPLPYGTCPMHSPELTPHLKPVYGASFDPNACYGPASFAPVHYSRWLASSPGTLYVVRYLPPSKP